MSNKVWLTPLDTANLVRPPSQPLYRGYGFELRENGYDRITDMAFCPSGCCLAVCCWGGAVFIAEKRNKCVR